MNKNTRENGIKQYFDLVEARLKSPITCHIMQIFNVSESKEKALEEWKYCQNPNKALFERMEHVSRPIIYGVDLEALDPEPEQKPRSLKATYKLLLRDSSGDLFYAMEIEELPFLHPHNKSTKNPLPIPLGGRLTLKEGTLVAEGIVLLSNRLCTYSAPDPSEDLTKQLNDGIVGKTIDMLERLLKNTE